MCEIIYETEESTNRNYAFLTTKMVLEFGANTIALQKQASFCLLFRTLVTKEKKQAPVCVRLSSVIATINSDAMPGDIAL